MSKTMPNKAMKALVCRDYREADLEQLARIVAEVWCPEERTRLLEAYYLYEDRL